jgi:hypothetical protein
MHPYMILGWKEPSEQNVTNGYLSNGVISMGKLYFLLHLCFCFLYPSFLSG